VGYPGRAGLDQWTVRLVNRIEIQGWHVLGVAEEDGLPGAGPTRLG
jgi:hypothetical protein